MKTYAKEPWTSSFPMVTTQLFDRNRPSHETMEMMPGVEHGISAESDWHTRLLYAKFDLRTLGERSTGMTVTAG